MPIIEHSDRLCGQRNRNPILSEVRWPVEAAPADDAFARLGAQEIDQQQLFGAPYEAHLATLAQRLEGQLERTGFEQLILTAGAPRLQLFDDLPTTFRSNPHLRHWLPLEDSAGCALILRPGQRPQLHFPKPADYWHLVPEVPFWAQDRFEVIEHDSAAAVASAVAEAARGHNATALVGDPADHGEHSGAASNPANLLAELDYERGLKTAFEVLCMTLATRRGVAGHLAAATAFEARGSEYEIHQAYLQASLQTDHDLPYGNIVALNAHAAVLHYQHQDRRPPAQHHSLLIDAGARCHGYASDITRTYAGETGPFADLIRAVDRAQQAVIRNIRPGLSYVTLHERMHEALANILCDAGILRCSAEQALEEALTLPFMPHGLGHLIGLQTHEVAGLQDRQGNTLPPPNAYPALRTTRTIEVGQTFTIEPGLYFIPMLLDPLLEGPTRDRFDAAALTALAPCGGIRIEDNVLVGTDQVTNLTRVAFAEQA